MNHESVQDGASADRSESAGADVTISGRVRGTLSALIPDGWFARETLEIASVDARVSVSATAEPLMSDVTLEEFAEGHGAVLSELPGYSLLDVTSSTLLGGRPAKVRTYEWTPNEGATVRQVSGYVIGESMTYVLTATAAAADFDANDDELRALLDSIDLVNQVVVVEDGTTPAEIATSLEWGHTLLSRGQNERDFGPESIDVNLDWTSPRSSWKSSAKGVSSDG